MIGFHLTRRAERDVRKILGHYSGLSYEVADRVFDDIEGVFAQLKEFPESGPRTAAGNFRRAVSAKYKFVVLYRYDGTSVTVSQVYRHQNREF